MKKTNSNLIDTSNRLRKLLFDTICEAGGGHFGGNLSMVEIMTVLFFKEMYISAEDPSRNDRDRFVMSKGHAGPVLYSTLAMLGYLPREELKTLDKPGSRLQKHVTAGKIPGIDVSTGSLGHGLSIAAGMAAAAKNRGLNTRVFAVLGDGECDEGQIWEAAMTASKYKLDNLIVIVDCNHLQIDGTTSDVLSIEPLREKWEAFGFFAQEIDGHSIPDILKALENTHTVNKMPSVILADTVKGKGISFMENNADWHANGITEDQRKIGMAELENCHE